MKREQGSPLGLYMIGIAALFLAGFLLLMVFGAQSYRGTVTGQNDNMDSRALLSYLSTTLKGYDERGAVTVRQDAEGCVLTVADGGSGYAVHIYCRDGKLLEEYAPLEAEPDPEAAQLIGETRRFEAEQREDGLLALYTDAGHVLIRLRSEGGAP